MEWNGLGTGYFIWNRFWQSYYNYKWYNYHRRNWSSGRKWIYCEYSKCYSQSARFIDRGFWRLAVGQMRRTRPS